MRHPPITAVVPAIAVIVLTVVLVVPTGAVSVTDADSEPDRTDHVELTPSSSSNGQYASVENGELNLNFNALNDRATSTFDDVFSIAITDDSVQRVWISNDIDAVTFYQNGDRHAPIDESNPIEPVSNHETTVGVAIDTHGDVPASETFTVHVEYEEDDDDTDADVELVDVAYSDAELAIGEPLTVNATYRNAGDDRGSTIASLVVDGIVVDRQVVHVGAGETETVTFERSMDRSGTFAVGVDDRKPESITVWPPGEPAPEFAVTDVDLETDTVTRGESAAVTATIENTGNATGTTSVELAVGGAVVDAKPVELDPGETTTVTFEYRFDDPGEYAIAVGGVDAGTLTVTEREPIQVLNREFHSSTTAAVAPAAVLGLLFAATGVRRRELL